MEEKKKSNKKIIIGVIVGLVIVILIGIIIFLLLMLNSNSNSNNNSISNKKTIKEQKQALTTTSFANLKADNQSFDEIQSQIIDYFDINYFENFYVGELQQYPQIFNESKLKTNAIIIKVLKSTDEEFEVLAYQGGSMSVDGRTGQVSTWTGFYGEVPQIEELTEDRLMIINGKQLEKRLLKGDVITLYGIYKNVNNFEIDGKQYILPVMNTTNVIQLGTNEDTNYRFNLKTIKNVAEYIFGKDIKINKPVVGEDYDNDFNYTFDPFYKITLENQSNANFSTFNMYRNYGLIKYNEESKGVVRKIYVSTDFQHYIITNYDLSLKHAYLEYFDKNLKKIWSREFDKESMTDDIFGPFDYNTEQLAMVIDNDLHLIDMKTGEDKIEPMLVGTKVNVNMMEDGIVLIGNDNKDIIMKVSFDGKIIYRTNGNVKFKSVTNAQTQVNNGKMVVCIYGYKEVDMGEGAYEDFQFYKYLVINEDGTLETSTEDADVLI